MFVILTKMIFYDQTKNTSPWSNGDSELNFFFQIRILRIKFPRNMCLQTKNLSLERMSCADSILKNISHFWLIADELDRKNINLLFSL